VPNSHVNEKRKQLQSQIDDLVKKDANGAVELARTIETATSSLNEARLVFRNATDGNQIYRLAASWFGVSTSDVTSEQFATARWVFATFSSIAVALAGSISALVYYARNRAPGAPSPFGTLMVKVALARRAYYARKRRPLKVEVPGPERVIYRDGKESPVVVEKEVPRFIDRIVLIPRWGIRVPTYINSLVRASERSFSAHPKVDASADVTSNVTTLSKKVS
jgi:hypothetical protein